MEHKVKKATLQRYIRMLVAKEVKDAFDNSAEDLQSQISDLESRLDCTPNEDQIVDMINDSIREFMDGVSVELNY